MPWHALKLLVPDLAQFFPRSVITDEFLSILARSGPDVLHSDYKISIFALLMPDLTQTIWHMLCFFFKHK